MKCVWIGRRYLGKPNKRRLCAPRPAADDRPYIEAASLQQGSKEAPLFSAAIDKTGHLAATAFHGNDICRMMKPRLADASLPARLSPDSFRVTVSTDLLEQGVPLDEVQQLAGHADPRTTRLYDRRQKKVTRNIVERISI